MSLFAVATDKEMSGTKVYVGGVCVCAAAKPRYAQLMHDLVLNFSLRAP